ncbi:MAG: Gfo/Idh/MocA family oxidoreductase [Planctomycetes bacterium]|nr:Gfo/Idh/MocA family oxidoreductase [Planctomycetota bacterium]
MSHSPRSAVARRCSRRDVLRAAALSVAGFAAPTVLTRHAIGRQAPSNRITLGVIGCGHQSTRVIPAFLACNDAEIVAVCDVNKGGTGYYHPGQFLGRDAARQWVDFHHAQKHQTSIVSRCAAYSDFRELIARDDIDAVVIIVPDHWHALIAIAAMRAGKDVYCEKPLALTIEQGRKIVTVARQEGRVFQVGAQFRSSPAVRHACELVRNGRLGEIRRVRTWVDANSFEGPGPGWQPQPIPNGFDYEMWLGPAPEVPFHAERCFFRWRYILDYSNGQTTNFGAHTNDIAQWALGFDGTTPVEFEDAGSEFLPPGSLFTTASKTAFRARYATGLELLCETRKSSGTKFEGTEGALEITLGGSLKTYPENLKDSVIGPNEIHLPMSNPEHHVHVRNDVDTDHAANFLAAVKSRRDPIQPVETGHSTASLCILGNAAQVLKRKFTWDPALERSSDSEVNAFLSRPLRAPWTL